MRKLIFYTILIVSFLLFPILSFSANPQYSSNFHEYTITDTVQAASSYGINGISIRQKSKLVYIKRRLND